MEFALAELKHGLSREDLLAVAKRSSELLSANKAIKPGDELKEATSETYFLWPEDGPDDTWG